MTSLSIPASTVLLSKQDGSEHLTTYNAWEYPDHLTPLGDSPLVLATLNSGSMDLHKFDASTIDLLSTSQPSSSNVSNADSTSTAKRGMQMDFDADVPLTQESIWQRDFRRSTVIQLDKSNLALLGVSDEPPQTMEGTLAGSVTKKDNLTANAPSAPQPALAKSSSSVSSKTAEKKAPLNRTTPKKRKSTTEGVVVETESPKRRKVSSKAAKKNG